MEFVPQHAFSWLLVGSISNWLNHDNDHNGWDPLTNRAIPGWSSQMSLTHQTGATDQLVLCFEELDASAQLPPRDLSVCAMDMHRSLEGSWCKQGCSFTNLSAFWAIGTIDVLVRLVNETRGIPWMNDGKWTWMIMVHDMHETPSWTCSSKMQDIIDLARLACSQTSKRPDAPAVLALTPNSSLMAML